MFTECNDLYPRYYSMYPNHPKRYRKVMNEDIAQDILQMGIKMIDNIIPNITKECWGNGDGNRYELEQSGRSNHDEEYIKYLYRKFHRDGDYDPRRSDMSWCAMDPDPYHECRKCGKWSDWH